MIIKLNSKLKIDIFIKQYKINFQKGIICIHKFTFKNDALILYKNY